MRIFPGIFPSTLCTLPSRKSSTRTPWWPWGSSISTTRTQSGTFSPRWTTQSSTERTSSQTIKCTMRWMIYWPSNGEDCDLSLVYAEYLPLYSWGCNNSMSDKPKAKHHPVNAELEFDFIPGPVKIKDGLFMGDELAAKVVCLRIRMWNSLSRTRWAT